MDSPNKEKMKLQVTARTHTGMQREGNEDNFIVSCDLNSPEWILPKDEYENSGGGTVLVVADGMGGLNAGEVASKIVVDSVRAYLSNPANGAKEASQLLADAILNANASIVAHSRKDPETEGMGSTVVMALLRDSMMYVAWVGDSRCYILRNGSLAQISKDHSYVQTLVDQGKITKEQAFIHPESNIITQSLGDDNRKPKPGTVSCALQNNDLILLCSDGLNGMLMDDAIEDILKQDTSLAQIADRLITAANDEGGADNITVALAKVVGGGATVNLPGTNKDSDGTEDVKKKRGLLYVMLLLVMVVIGAAGYYLSTHQKDKKQKQQIKPHDTTKKVISGKDTSRRPAHLPEPERPKATSADAANAAKKFTGGKGTSTPKPVKSVQHGSSTGALNQITDTDKTLTPVQTKSQPEQKKVLPNGQLPAQQPSNTPNNQPPDPQQI